MSEELKPMDEIRAYMREREQSTAEQVLSEKTAKEKPETQAVVAVEETKKAISDLSVADIKIKIDENRSMEEQAEDIVGAMATANAVQDKETARELTEMKSEELLAKAETKKKQAQTEETKAEVAKQEANRTKNEAVLQTFGINKHLPDWLLKIMVVLFSPVYVLLTILIGIPCGFVKVIIDNIDNILVRYETADDKNRPKIKATIWILLILGILAGVAFIVLTALGKI